MSWWRRRRTVEAGAERAARAVDRLLWERRFERLGLAVLVVLYLLGFHAQNQNADDLKATAAKLATVATQTNDSLCALRRDVETRAENARAFLHAHPHGFAGFSSSAIRVSLVGQERTVRALSGLNCPPEKLP